MIPATVAWWLLTLARVATFVSLLPPFLGKSIPPAIKVGVALALTLFWVGQPAAGPTLISVGLLVVLVVKEVLTGAALACCLELLLLPSRMVGASLNEELGLSFASTVSPNDNSSQNVMSQLLESLGAALFFSMRLDLLSYRLLHATFEKNPVGGAIWLPRIDWVVAAMERMEEAGWVGGASVLCVTLAAGITLLVMTRWVPQLHLFSVGFQIRVLVGLVTIVLFLPEICQALTNSMRSLVDDLATQT